MDDPGLVMGVERRDEALRFVDSDPGRNGDTPTVDRRGRGADGCAGRFLPGRAPEARALSAEHADRRCCAARELDRRARPRGLPARGRGEDEPPLAPAMTAPTTTVATCKRRHGEPEPVAVCGHRGTTASSATARERIDRPDDRRDEPGVLRPSTEARRLDRLSVRCPASRGPRDDWTTLFTPRKEASREAHTRHRPGHGHRRRTCGRLDRARVQQGRLDDVGPADHHVRKSQSGASTRSRSIAAIRPGSS